MMNRFLGFASLGLAIVALAVALSGSREPQAPITPTDHRSASSSSQDVQALEKRVKSLEDTAVSLSSRIMALERRAGTSEPTGGGAAAGAPPAALAQEVEQLKTEVQSMVAGEALNSEGGREYLKEMVRSVQDEMRTAQRQERQQQWAQAQAQAQTDRTERLHKFASEAGLNYSQEQDLTRRLQDEETQRQALFDAVRDGSKSPQDARQESRTLRTQTDEAIRGELNDDQRAKYDEMRREDRGGMRPGGWPPGGAGGAGGPGGRPPSP